jgi:hypothetical protein
VKTRIAVLAFIAIVAGLGITALVQSRQAPTATTVSVSPETVCRNTTRRALDSLAHGRIKQSKAQAMVDGACNGLPEGTRDAIVQHEKDAAIARNLPATPSN